MLTCWCSSPLPAVGHLNWDLPRAFDIALLMNVLKLLILDRKPAKGLDMNVVRGTRY